MNTKYHTCEGKISLKHKTSNKTTTKKEGILTLSVNMNKKTL